MKGRGWMRAAALLALVLVLLAVPVMADMGPKDQLTITVVNPPDELYYLDLLTPECSSYDNLYQEEGLDEQMVQALFDAAPEGWGPALAGGTGVPMWGDLVGTPDQDGNMVHSFGYVGVPTVYRIVVVTQSGQVQLGPETRRLVMQSSAVYDYAANTLRTPPVWLAYLMQYLATCLPTVLLELAVLVLFRFSLRQNLALVIGVNAATQLALTAIVGTALLQSGTLSAWMLQLPVELGILLAEMAVYYRWLKGHSPRRRCAYAAAANLLSWAVGFFTIPQQFYWMVRWL